MRNPKSVHSNRLHKYWARITILVLVLLLCFVPRCNSLLNLTKRLLVPDNLVLIDNQSGSKGYIISPYYPESAPINSTASALLQIIDDYNEYDSVRLSFVELNLQTSNNCVGEVVNVYLLDQDTSFESSEIIYAFCGSRHLEPVIISGNQILLEFSSDEFVQPTTNSLPRGFIIKYEFINRKKQLHEGCDELDQFKCRNRKCISRELVCNKFDDCGDASDEDHFTPCPNAPTIPYRTDYQCGRARFGTNSRETPDTLLRLLQNRIVGGSSDIVDNHRLPQVSIQITGIEPISHVCGGVLIHPLFVLSSAHCFMNRLSAYSYKLIFGTRDLRSTGYQLRYAHFISIYPHLNIMENINYGDSNLERANKLALIELNAPVLLNSQVWPACLPHLGEPIQAKRECFTTGYGETRGSGQPFAMKQTIQTINHPTECRSPLSDFDLDDYSMVCVANPLHAGPCNGDSGGPLLCRDNHKNKPVNVSEPSYHSSDQSSTARVPGELLEYLEIVDEDYSNGGQKRSRKKLMSEEDRYTVHGITSFTTDGNMSGGFCAVARIPVIYGRVSTRIDWILSVMKTALFRLNKADRAQDKNSPHKFFGYMFRSGYSQHIDFTPSMTIA